MKNCCGIDWSSDSLISYTTFGRTDLPLTTSATGPTRQSYREISQRSLLLENNKIKQGVYQLVDCFSWKEADAGAEPATLTTLIDTYHISC